MTVLSTNKPGKEGEYDLTLQMLNRIFPNMPQPIVDILLEVLGPYSDYEDLSDEEFEEKLNKTLGEPRVIEVLKQNASFFTQFLLKPEN